MTDDESEKLLCLMKKARQDTGLPLDFWADFLEGIPYKWAAILCGRSDMLPKNRNSSGMP